MKSLTGIILAAFLFILLVGGCSVVGSYNGLTTKEQNVNEKWSQVENVYQRRFDLIPNLVQTVQGAAQFEKDTFTDVAKARASVGQLKIEPGQAPATAEQLDKFQQSQGQLGAALSRLMVVSEKYPELKANANFRDLQVQLEGTENRIAVERRNFNLAVKDFNTTSKQFPTNIFAGMFGFAPKPYFQSEEGAQHAPKVQFSFNPNKG